jgi:ABC-type glycerol-3-phosphate transport system permease component
MIPARGRPIIRRALVRARGLMLILATCGLAVFPFYWMLVSSFSGGARTFSSRPVFWPEAHDLGSYRSILVHTDLGGWLWNSCLVSTLATAAALVVGTSGGYALSRFRYRGKQAFALAILITQMIPPLVLVIPFYKIFILLGLLDTKAALVLGNFAFALPVVTWMMKSIFDTIPVDIEEAARVDGASWPRVLLSITAPLALPGFAATAIYAFIEAWDEFLMARTLVSSPENWVASIGLASFIGFRVTPWDQIMAASVLFSLPPILLFLAVQRYFIAGLGAGAVKG